MKREALLVILLVSISILFYGVIDEIKSSKPSDLYLQEQERLHNEKITKYNKGVESSIAAISQSQIKNTSESLTNFEGPTVEIDYLMHHGVRWDKEKSPNFTITGSELKFDPDHSDYGLPDLHVELSQPRFISPLESDIKSELKSEIQKYIPSVGNIQPVKTYFKTMEDQEGRYSKEQFDLYITEFSINIGIKPLRKKPTLSLTRKEKKKKIFPRYWYQDDIFRSSSRKISIDDFNDPQENKNKRYSKVSIVFKITPNHSAWYVDSAFKQQVDPKVAIGSIVTKHISSNIKVESDYKEAQIIPGSPGINIKMYTDRDLAGLFPAAKVMVNSPDRISDSIFDQESIYFRIVSNNIGSWDNRFAFWGEEWDDQFTVKFFMPILVKGKLEVTLDPALKPQYVPPEQFHNKLSLSDIIPDWGLDNIGKYISYILIIIMLLVIALYIPNLFTLINAGIGFIIGLLKKHN